MIITNDINILAIETATSACSVALSVGDSLFERSELGNNIHSQKLLGMINAVLSEANLKASALNAVAVGQGPGSFTGLRIGIGVAQGISFGVGCQMIGVSSLAALARQVTSNGYVLAGIDARMNEIYWGAYKVSDGEVILLNELQVSHPTAIDLKGYQLFDQRPESDKILLVGNAWSIYEKEFAPSFFDQVKHMQDSFYPQAKEVLLLAQRKLSNKQTVSPVDFSPEYVRNNVAVKKAT